MHQINYNSIEIKQLSRRLRPAALKKAHELIARVPVDTFIIVVG